MRRCIFAALAALSLSSGARATTVVAPTFETLVAQADAIVQSEVVDTKARIVPQRDGAPIVTDVYFRIEKVLKGAPASTLILQFLGGQVGDLGFRVDGVPSFSRGDRDVLFAITAAPLVSPIVGMMHGRVRITADAATRQDIVRVFDGTPLRDVRVLGSTANHRPQNERPAMTLSAFESAVTSEVARQAAKGQRP
jgi:hypothetical protein